MTEVKAKMAEKMIKQIMDELSAMRSGQEELDIRVVAIEEKPDVNPKLQRRRQRTLATMEMKTRVISNCQIIQGNAREKSLRLTFGGGGRSPTALRLFMDHYNLAKSQNMKGNVAGWGDVESRANELRYQLRGEPALLLSQEDSMLSSWMMDDVDCGRYLKAQGKVYGNPVH